MGTHLNLRSQRAPGMQLWVIMASRINYAHIWLMTTFSKFQHPSRWRQEARNLNHSVLIKKCWIFGPSNLSWTSGWLWFYSLHYAGCMTTCGLVRPSNSKQLCHDPYWNLPGVIRLNWNSLDSNNQY
jgi:hypothetical protein